MKWKIVVHVIGGTRFVKEFSLGGVEERDLLEHHIRLIAERGFMETRIVDMKEDAFGFVCAFDFIPPHRITRIEANPLKESGEVVR